MKELLITLNDNQTVENLVKFLKGIEYKLGEGFEEFFDQPKYTDAFKKFLKKKLP